jgi:uncharacterized protein (DUF1810 family)
MTDPYDLKRFVTAQAPVYADALAELRTGRKRTHWMWFVFPQLRGLGSSPTALRYSIGSLDEARAYLAHPLLGARLRESTKIVATSRASTLHALFGSPDDVKMISSATLFALADAGETNVFRATLARWSVSWRRVRRTAMPTRRSAPSRARKWRDPSRFRYRAY